MVWALRDPECPEISSRQCSEGARRRSNQDALQDGQDETQSDHQTGVAVRRPRSFTTAGPPFQEKINSPGSQSVL